MTRRPSINTSGIWCVCHDFFMRVTSTHTYVIIRDIYVIIRDIYVIIRDIYVIIRVCVIKLTHTRMITYTALTHTRMITYAHTRMITYITYMLSLRMIIYITYMLSFVSHICYHSCMCAKRDLYLCEKSPICVRKEPYSHSHF